MSTMFRLLGWDKLLTFWESGEWQKIVERLDDLDEANTPYIPARIDMFEALERTPPDKVKVVILGQDPYPNKKHAMGVAFSVPRRVKDLPKSLKNVLKELKDDLNISSTHGDLSSWCAQGVLLWNVIPSVFPNRPLSHENWWEWEELTKEILEVLNKGDNSIVFMAWGTRAATWLKDIDTKKHRVLKFGHPSPRAAHKRWFGTRPFSTCNASLVELNLSPINWNLDYGREQKAEISRILEGMFDVFKAPKGDYDVVDAPREDIDVKLNYDIRQYLKKRRKEDHAQEDRKLSASTASAKRTGDVPNDQGGSSNPNTPSPWSRPDGSGRLSHLRGKRFRIPTRRNNVDKNNQAVEGGTEDITPPPAVDKT